MAATGGASITVFVFFIVTGAVAGPVGAEVDDRNHFCFEVALGEDDTDALVVTGGAFEGISWAGSSVGVAFFVVDGAVLHDFLHFCLGDFSAAHAAFGVLGVFDIGDAAVESVVAVNVRGGVFCPAVVGGVGGIVGFGLLRVPCVLELADHE